MDKKELIRKKSFLKRKKKYRKINNEFFTPLARLLKQIFKKKKIKISIYYPSSFEVDLLGILNLEYFSASTFLLPMINKNNTMNFYKWSKKDILQLNKFGIPEPLKKKEEIPDVVLVPLLAFDKKKNRLGYGKGFYDKFLNAHAKLKKNILTVGIAFSFQKYHKLPVNHNDFKLDYILTEKGLIK